MPNDLESTIHFTCMSLDEMLTLCPEQFILCLMNKYPDALEKLEAGIANLQVQEFLRSVAECD